MAFRRFENYVYGCFGDVDIEIRFIGILIIGCTVLKQGSFSEGMLLTMRAQLHRSLRRPRAFEIVTWLPPDRHPVRCAQIDMPPVRDRNFSKSANGDKGSS